MKVEINEKVKAKVKAKVTGFPKLMICKGEKTKGLVVFFESEGSGQSLNQVGIYYSGYGSIHWEMDQFQDFEGSITLSND